MDAFLSSQSHAGQRSKTTYPRAPSRASTVASNPRSLGSSNNSSLQQPTSPAQSFVYPHRFNSTAAAAKSPRSGSRPASQLSRAASGELTRPPTMSSFLQEKLEKERRAESEKLGSSTSSRHNFDMSTSSDVSRGVQDRSFRSSDGEPQRPQSSAGVESCRKRGLGVKEMEQVVSSLHKQNFDLKLELYHRRERQTKMEARLDALEARHQQTQKLNQKLLADLENRDKAIEEAVTMIVELEARVDQLMDERTMVKHVESHGFYPSTDSFPDLDDSIADSSTADLSQPEDRSKTPTIHRMPSFLSDHKRTTENLRNAYLHNRGSVLSLQKNSGGQSDTGHVGLASPTLSVLSESSFISIYGQKEDDTAFIPDFDEPVVLSGFERCSPVIIQESPPPGFVNQNDQSNQPDTSKENLRGKTCQTRPDSSANLPARQYVQDDRRSALRRVVTDAPGGVRLHDQALPPTPDTISSSTLQRYRNSNEHLSVHGQASDERRKLDSTPDVQSARDNNGIEPSEGVPLPRKEASLNVPGTRHDTVPMPSYDPYGAKNILRPHSAGDTTISHRRRCSWDSDDSDAKSLQSSLDIWMRESTKPVREETGRASPDLFGFPSSMARAGWDGTPLFGSKPKNLGAMPSTDFMHDLLSLRDALLTPKQPPPPPDRRSSLVDCARPASAMPTCARPQASDETWQLQPAPPLQAAGHESTHGRVGDGADLRGDMRTPVQGEQKKGASHPPISWQHGPRAGLKGFFRRSLTGSLTGSGSMIVSSPARSESGPFGQEAESTPPSRAWRSSSGSAALAEPDRSGATPPPITLNPRQGRRKSVATSSVDGVASPDMQSVQGDASSQLSLTQSQSTGTSSGTLASGMRRKWLPGFSRSNKA